MSQLDVMRTRNNHARLVRHPNACGSHRNCVRISAANSLTHETAKLALVHMLIKDGHEVLTEAIFCTGGRADVLDLDTGDVYEIVASETEEQLVRKCASYPHGLRVIMVKAETGESRMVRG